MSQPTREEHERMADAPKGTYALMLVAAALLFAGWVIFYFGRFFGNGPVR